MNAINIVFDGPPGPKAGRFVEVETDDGHSIRVGEWIKRDDGLWALRIDCNTVPYVPDEVRRLPEAMKKYRRERGPEFVSKNWIHAEGWMIGTATMIRWLERSLATPPEGEKGFSPCHKCGGDREVLTVQACPVCDVRIGESRPVEHHPKLKKGKP